MPTLVPESVSDPRIAEAQTTRIYRHTILVRVSHWINVICLTLLLMSGMQIFNAHPRLYWGQYGANADPALLEMTAVENSEGRTTGSTRVGPFQFETTGIFGLSKANDQWAVRGFPAWLTLPSYQDLAAGRRWHFLVAWLFVINGIVYLAHGAWSGHFRRDIIPSREELRARHLGRDILDHLLLKKPVGEAARRYNTLQKLAYLIVIFLLLPLMLLTGLTMSPGINAALPVLLDIFDGRQSARTLHFISAVLIIAFALIHIAEVIIAGVWNEMWGMVTGWYDIKREAHDEKT